MIRTILCLILTGAMALSASTDVMLTGTVKDGTGKAIADASVTLVNKATLTDSTNAQGEFELKTEVGVATPYEISIPASSKITGIGNVVQFSLTGPIEQGNIAIFASSGRRIALLDLGKMAEGRHSVTLPELVPGFYVMSMNIGRETTTRKLMNTGSGLYISDVEMNATAGGFTRNAAGAAPVDTLVVTKSGYTTFKLALESYTKTDIAVVLTEATVTCDVPTLPKANAITYSNAKHPDAFTFKYGPNAGKKVTSLAEWECRRQEIFAMAQEYLYGHLPPKCEVKGTVSGGSIKAECTYNGKSATVSLNAQGSGDILVIQFGAGAPTPSGSRKASMNTSTMLSTAKSLFGSSDMGICAAGAWGVGRIIDALEQNPNSGIDPKKVMTTGCSTGGKQALIAAVFEPRVALAVPVESGCGGSCSWRVSSEYGHGNSNTDCQDITHLETNWLGDVASPWRNGNPKIDKLPLDQGELMAIRAPGATFAVNNYKDWMWLCAKGNVAAAQSCRWIYKTIGVPGNFGFSEPKSTHGHCSWANDITSDLNAFYDKFLNGKTDAKPDCMKWNSASEETSKWFEFGTEPDQWDTNLVLQ